MKKLLSLCLVLLLIISVSACAPNETVPEEDPPVDEEPIGEDPVDEEPGEDPDQEDPNEQDTDEVSGPSVVTDEESLQNAMSEDGTWIIIFLEDFSTEEELVLEGEFTNNDELDRKIALYAQDDDRNKTDVFTLTAPSLTITSENTRIQGGKFIGDVYVEANGFSLIDAEVEGNVYYASEDIQNTATIDETSAVSGDVGVQQ